MADNNKPNLKKDPNRSRFVAQPGDYTVTPPPDAKMPDRPSQKPVKPGDGSEKSKR